MTAGYKVLPEVYDRWQRSYGKDFSTLILPKLLQTIEDHKIPTTSLLDLACGTGTLALMMAKRRWRVFGIDASKGMVREAMRKTKGTKLSVEFSLQGMESFRLSQRVGMVLCMFDSINHLSSSRALLKCVKRVHASLVPGGYFIFDVNNELCYRTLWRQTEVIHEKKFTIILENTFDVSSRIGKSRVSLFLRRGSLFEGKSETVRERYYPREELMPLLQSVGFEVLESTDFNFTPNPLVGDIKTWWVSKKI